jgi:uncharacterized protein (TIGR00369 family)
MISDPDGTWATKRLDDLIADKVELPPVTQTLRLGTLNEWGAGWVKKHWTPSPEVMNVDGSLFGGYIAALADQVLAFATMTVVPGDKLFRTTNLAVTFTRIGKAHPLIIDAIVVAQTRQMITVRASFKREDGAVIAEATAQQILQTFGTT